MPIYDFTCDECGSTTEELQPSSIIELNCECGGVAKRMPPAPKLFSTIVPTTKTSKKHKAGYVHTHADRPKTEGKIQVGYTGPAKR